MLQQSEMLFFIKLKLIWRSWDGGGGPYVFHYRADILRKSRGVVLSDWFGKVVGVFYKLYFAAGFTSLQKEIKRVQRSSFIQFIHL